jgi:phage I-like protein
MAGKKAQAFELAGGSFALLLAIGDDAAANPPTEIVLFGSGVTETTKGPVLFDAKSGKDVMAAFADHGLDLLPFDIAHGMLNPFAPPDGAKAAAWFKPAVKGGALVASDIQWTPYGLAALQAREFRFFSPAVMRDRESGRPTELINVALTNIPATKGQKPLVADRTAGEPPRKGSSMDLEELLKLLGAQTAAQALSRHTEFNSLLQLSGKASVPEASAEFARWKASSDQCVKLAVRVTQLEDEQKSAKVDATIIKLSEEGKLPPSLHEWARTLTVAQLEQFAASAAPVAGGPTAPPVRAPAGGSLTLLSDEERVVCSQMNITEKDFLEAKKDMIAQDEARRKGAR